MDRITNRMINNTMNFNLQRHQKDMDKIQDSLATGKNVRMPRDNPVASTTRCSTGPGYLNLNSF